MTPRPTPETDAAAWTIDGTSEEVVAADFCRHIERDRDHWQHKAQVHSALRESLTRMYNELVEALGMRAYDLGIRGDDHSTVLATAIKLRKTTKQGGGK